MAGKSIFHVLGLMLVLSTQSAWSGVLSLQSSSSSSSSSESYEEYQGEQTVSVNLYYESLCPGCRKEYPQLPPLMKELGEYITLQTFPYGNAKMYKDENGIIEVECQHGEAECYGNKLHACAIDIIGNNAYVDFNSCMMTAGSDDDSADQCGQSLNIDAGPIKTCAKGEKGQKLLIHYGEMSEDAHYPYVPYVTINGKALSSSETIKQGVCDALDNQPDPCIN